MRKLALSLLLALLVCGCNKVNVVTNPDVQFQCKIRPVIITRTGWSEWTSQMMQEREAIVNPVYAKAKFNFTFLEPEYLERPDLYECRDAGFEEIARLSKELAETKGELGVYFVYSIVIGDFEAGGVSNYPSNRYGSIYQHGIAIACSSYIDVVAHELGHSFNLPHPWDDNNVITDTPSSGPNDCDILTKYCNIMSYCEDRPLRPECQDNHFSEQQLKMIRNWAASYPRSQVVTSIGFTPSAAPIYTNNIKPVF